MARTVIFFDSFKEVTADAGLGTINLAREIAGAEGTVIAGVLAPAMLARINLANSFRQIDSAIPDCPHAPEHDFFHLLGVTDIVCTTAPQLSHCASLCLAEVTVHDGIAPVAETPAWDDYW